MNPALIGAILVAGLIALVLITVAGAVATSRRRARSRNDAFERLALELDLAYEPKAARDFRDAWTVLPAIPKQGDVHHLMYGTHEGVPLTLFRHRYVVSTGQSAAVIIHWVFSTEVPAWPEVHVKRRAALPRALGKRSNIVLEDEHFDHHWVIKTTDAAFARALLAPRVREFLGAPRADGRKIRETWHVIGGKLCCVARADLDVDALHEQVRRLHVMLAIISGQRAPLAPSGL